MTGKAWRVDSGYQHDRGTTAGDVVRYEQDELGNDIDVDQVLLPYLDTLPAKRLVWVTFLYANALRYGRPERYNLGDNWQAIGQDGDGGWLILLGERG